MTNFFNGTPRNLVVWKLFGFPVNAYGCRTSCCTTSSKFRFMCAFNKCTNTHVILVGLSAFCFTCHFFFISVYLLFWVTWCIFSLYCLFFLYLCVFLHIFVLFFLLCNFFSLYSVYLCFSVCIHFLLACLTIY